MYRTLEDYLATRVQAGLGTFGSGARRDASMLEGGVRASRADKSESGSLQAFTL